MAHYHAPTDDEDKRGLIQSVWIGVALLVLVLIVVSLTMK